MDQPRIGIVLPAGGARAAYQIGVLRYIGETFPKFQPTIFSGISAGSINACFFAQGDPFHESAIEAARLWENLQFDHVLRSNFSSLVGMGTRWFYDLFVSKVTKKLLVKSLLDASPLASTLLMHIHFWKIARAVRSGYIHGISVTSTNYHDGTTAIFFDSFDPIPEWKREQRRAIRSNIRIRHVMASCSIPLLFEPVRIGDHLYGDGSLRFSFPLSPPIHMGASHILAVGIRCPAPEVPTFFKPEQVSLGFVAGTVLNSIFLDSLETDFENLSRMNQLGQGAANARIVQPFLVRPSQDLGFMARDFLNEIPFHLRQLLRSTANSDELGDLISYLMFSPPYLKALMDLGFKDAQNQHDALKSFLAPFI